MRSSLRWTLVFVLFLFIAAWITPTRMQDWHTCFQPGAQAVLHGDSPYTIQCFHNPPWAAIFVLPFSFGRLGDVVLVASIFFTVTKLSRRMGASVLGTFLVLISPPMYWLIRNAQLDWLTLWAVMTPTPMALLLAVIKPQIGVVLAGWLVYHEWRKDGIIRAIAVCIPFLAVLFLSFVWTGFWPANIPAPSNLSSNVSPWPWAIPLGIIFLILALAYDKVYYALLAGPFLTPYLVLYSFIGATVAASRWTWVMVLFVAIPYAVGIVMFLAA